MKNSIFNKKESGRRGNLLAALLMVTTSLLYCSSAWADTCSGGIQYESGAGISFAVNDNVIYRSNATGGNGVGLGVISSMKIKNLKLQAYQTGEYNDWGFKTFNLCDQTHFGYKIKSPANVNGTVVLDGDNQDLTVSWGEWQVDQSKKTKYRYPQWNKSAEFEALSTLSTPGEYRAEFWFLLQGKGCSGSACTDFQQYGKATNDSGDSGNFYVTFTLPGFTVTSTSKDFGSKAVGQEKSETISFTKHYGTALTTSDCAITGTNAADFTVTEISETGVTVKYQPKNAGGSDRSATLTITDAHGKTCTITLTGTATGMTTPTVLIAENERVVNDQVTLNGYVKYTGCNTITEVGFRIADNAGMTSATDYAATTAPSPIAAGSHFTLVKNNMANGTYYYKAYMKYASTTDVSEETRSFTISTECNFTERQPATMEPKFSANNEQTLTIDIASVSQVVLTTTTNASEYTWACTSKPDGAQDPIITDSDKRTATVSLPSQVSGTYTFTLTAKCSTHTSATTSNPITLYSCLKAGNQALTLDGYADNILCSGEGALAEIVSQSGYIYTLYRGDTKIGSQVGSGKTISWRNVEGAGNFKVTAYKTDLPACESISGTPATVGTATQAYNAPVLVISSVSSAMSYQPVTIDVDSEGSTEGISSPTWAITSGTGGYLLNSSTGIAYDGEAVDDVILKAAKETEGVYSAETYTVKATATKTVVATSTSPEKTCEATDSVNITVSPATEDCD